MKIHLAVRLGALCPFLALVSHPLTAAAPAAPASPASKVELDLVLEGPAQVKLEGSVALEPLTAGVAPQRLPVHGQLSVVVLLPPDTRWRASLEIPGCWAPPVVFTAGGPGVEVVQRLRVWPTGMIAG